MTSLPARVGKMNRNGILAIADILAFLTPDRGQLPDLGLRSIGGRVQSHEIHAILCVCAFITEILKT